MGNPDESESKDSAAENAAPQGAAGEAPEESGAEAKSCCPPVEEAAAPEPEAVAPEPEAPAPEPEAPAPEPEAPAPEPEAAAPEPEAAAPEPEAAAPEPEAPAPEPESAAPEAVAAIVKAEDGCAPPDAAPGGCPKATRRDVLTTALAGIGVAASYGTAAAFAARYLYPSSTRQAQKLFVGIADKIPAEGVVFHTPAGQNVHIRRQGKDLIALSDVCPHLGCKVHWNDGKSEFFCPCHEGAFDATGKPTGGPPLKAGTPLTRYGLSNDDGRIFIEVFPV